MTSRPRTPNRLALLLGGAAVAAGVMAPVLSPAATAAPVADAPTATRAAATWLAGQATDGVLGNGGFPDWGLTADSVFAYAAGGLGATSGATATDQLAAHVADYGSPLGGSSRSAGSIAKMLVVAVVQGRDVSAFGGWNLRGELLDLMDAQPGSVNLGRFRNSGQGDTSNGFSQSFAIIGLARTGTVPPEAVAYLVNQQCPAGGFRLFFTGGATCTNDDQADPDTTALATQALEAAKAAGAVGTDGPMAGGLDWLEAKQYPDGALPGSGPTALVPNANSTGIAAQALRAGGRTDAADLAVAWVRSMQLDCDAPGVAGGQGAVAYDPAGHDAAVAAGSIGAGFADQYRRTTAMATLGLGAVSFATLTTVAPGGSVEFDCEQVPPSSSTSSTSSTSSSTTSSTSSTTSSTSTTSAPAATSTSTTIAAVLGPSASAVNNVAVEAATQVAGSGSSGSGSSGLAVTGADAMSLVALGFGLASVGSALIAARRRR